MDNPEPIEKSNRCKDCKYERYHNTIYPCSECSRNEFEKDRYQSKESEEEL